MIEDRGEDLFEDAPCGYLTSRLDGTIVRVNRTLEAWTGHGREALLGRPFQDLLTAGGRIYFETHLRPLLHMQGAVREIAVDIVRADGGRMPALVNAVVHGDVVRTTVLDATDRRRYEQELVRAREREHEIALALQRSLLQGELPQDERLDLAVVYKPAGRSAEVGGDWYDAFWLDEPGRVGLVLGDVVGRGLAASAAMGQLRSAARALASTGLGPAALLEALDRYVRRHGVGEMTTVACAWLDLGTRRLRWACAGHPPPALATPAGAELLWEGRSPPLDVAPASSRRPEAEVVLAAGSTLVLYSDGLVERADLSLDGRFDVLLAALEATGAAPARTTAEAVTERLLGRAPPVDDVCVVAARLPV